MLNKKTKVKDTNNKRKLAYHKPKVYRIGSMDKVQGGYRGYYREPYGYYSG